MEVGVRLIGIFLRLINFLLGPYNWFVTRNRKTVPPVKDPILLKSAVELIELLKECKIKSEHIITSYINRINEVNPYINAVVDERFLAAIEDAKSVDRLIAERYEAGSIEELFQGKPLLGLPVTVKESCSLAGLSNAVGCLKFAGRRATSDGEAVRRARAAGAIPLLVSNTPELCLGWETCNLISGYTNNPYCLSRSAGGSSGGEAALLGSAASLLSIASDIAGSIRLPAAFCGVYGLKPTPGIVPIEGHIPTLADENFPRFLAVGPMARRAADLALLLRALAGGGRRLGLDDPVDFTKLKVFYMTEATTSLALIAVDARIKKLIVQAAEYLEKCGAEICHEKFKELEDSVDMSVSVFFQMKDIPNLLQDPDNPKRDKSIIMEFLRNIFGGATCSLQALGFALLLRTRLLIPRSRERHYARLAARCRGKLQRILNTTGVLLYPVYHSTAHAHGRVFWQACGVAYSMPCNVLGVPAVSVPVHAQHVPLHLQVIAAPHQDRLCLAVAEKLEGLFGGWKPPQ